MLQRARALPPFLLFTLVSAVVVGLIWLPFGTALGALIEEWGLLGLFTTNPPFFFITAHTPFAAHLLRPLTVFPQAMGYWLNPDSFLFWHLQQMLFIGVKGIAIAGIVWWLGAGRALAAFGGALMMLYPADTMQLAFRSLHINGAAALLLMAVALLLLATNRTGWQQLAMALAAVISFVLACWMYEAALFMTPAPLLLWWAKFGFREGWLRLKAQWPVIALWLAGILFAIGYIGWASHQPGIYQQSVSGNPLATLWVMLRQSPKLVTIGLYRTVLHGWWDAAGMLLAGGVWMIYVPVAAIAASLFARMAFRTTEAMLTPIWRRMLLAALGMMVLGYLPYLSSLAHLLITQRTYLFAQAGGALMFTALIALLLQCKPMLGNVAITCSLLLGIAAQWTQFAHYGAVWRQQTVLLSGIVEAAPELVPNQPILIEDRAGWTGNTWMLRGEILRSALTYLYGFTVEPNLCLQPGNLWSSFNGEPTGQLKHCVETKTAWEIGGGASAGGVTLLKKDVLHLVIAPDGRVYRADGKPSVAWPAAKAARLAGILGCVSAADCYTQYHRAALPDRFRANFGTWWSLEEVPPGAGWRDPQWTPPSFSPRSFSWKDQPESSLWFPLKPVAAEYQLTLRLEVWTLPAAKDALVLRVNGVAVPHRWIGTKKAVATVPSAMLREGMNEIRLISPVDTSQGVSLGVDWVRLTPIQSPE